MSPSFRNRVATSPTDPRAGSPGEDAAPGRTEAAAESILAQLRRLNSEFAHYVPPGYQIPRVTLLPAGDPDYFPVGVKHRYTRG